MRPWITAAASTAAALVVAAALVRPELMLTPRSALLSSLVPVLPAFAVAALAVYGLCTIWLCAAAVIAEIVSLRRLLERGLIDHDIAAPSVFESVPSGALRRLLIAQPAPAGVAVMRRLSPGQVRREIVHLFYLAAARGQFFSALIVLAAIVALGAAQQQGALAIVPGPIPTVAAALAVAGLVLLALLARIGIDVSAEPLIDALAGLPAEAALPELVRGSLARIEAAATQPREASPATLPSQMADRLVVGVEQSQQALSAASERLAATVDWFAATANASITALAETLGAGETTAQGANLGSEEAVAAMAQLRDAVARLTALLEHLRTEPTAAPESPPASAAPRREPHPDLAEELRKLLQEIDAAP